MALLQITKAQLLPPLLLVLGAVDKKQSLAILSHILVTLEEGKLSLTATDLEMEISATIPCSHKEERMQFTVPAKKFIDIMRSLEDETPINIDCKANTLLIKVGRSQFKLSTLPDDLFPRSAKESSEFQLEIPKQKLFYLFQSTFIAMSQQQDVRIFLNGLLFEIDSLGITTVAMDGHRMALCKHVLNQELPSLRLLLPRKGIQEMLRLLQAETNELVTISGSKTHFSLTTSSYTFVSKLIDAQFPSYLKAIPRANDKFITIDKESLKRGLSRILILAHEKSKAVCMHIQADSLTLIAHNEDQEEALEVIEAQVDGEELKIGINACYLLDVLQCFSEPTVHISLSATDSSILVQSLGDEQYKYIIMPMKL